METVDVRVSIFWCGETKRISVPVEVQSFEPGKRCARSIAAIKAGALMGIPFTDLLRTGAFEMLKKDKARLRELFGETPHPSPAATPSALGCQLQEQSSGNGKEIHNSPPDCCAQGEGFAGDGETDSSLRSG